MWRRHSCPMPRQRSQSLAPGGLPGYQKGVWKLTRATELEGSEILVPIPIRHVRILRLPLSEFEQVVLGNPPLPRAISQVGPLLQGSRSHWIFGILQRPRIKARNSSTIRSCSFRSSLARFSFILLKNSRFRFDWLSRPRRTSAAIALLMLESTVSAYRSTSVAIVAGRPTLYRGPGLPRRFGLDLRRPALRPLLSLPASE